jgi:hypothetical protein
LAGDVVAFHSHLRNRAQGGTPRLSWAIDYLPWPGLGNQERLNAVRDLVLDAAEFDHEDYDRGRWPGLARMDGRSQQRAVPRGGARTVAAARRSARAGLISRCGAAPLGPGSAQRRARTASAAGARCPYARSPPPQVLRDRAAQSPAVLHGGVLRRREARLAAGGELGDHGPGRDGHLTLPPAAGSVRSWLLCGCRLIWPKRHVVTVTCAAS